MGSTPVTITRRDVVLAALAAGGASEHSPVQVQKLLFLIDRFVGSQVGGPHFSFAPYNYGPFDKAVYRELEDLASGGEVELRPDQSWYNYRLSPAGQGRGQAILDGLPSDARDYVLAASKFVRSLSFSELVSSIYKAFPEMRANSVFQG